MGKYSKRSPKKQYCTLKFTPVNSFDKGCLVEVIDCVYISTIVQQGRKRVVVIPDYCIYQWTYRSVHMVWQWLQQWQHFLAVTIGFHTI